MKGTNETDNKMKDRKGEKKKRSLFLSLHGGLSLSSVSIGISLCIFFLHY